MIAAGGTTILKAARLLLVRNWLAALLVLLIAVFFSELTQIAKGLQATVFSGGAVGVLATIVGIFLVFRFNEAYARWWEARTLWGELVNASRTFARQTTALLTARRLAAVKNDAAAQNLQRELVYRQIAFVHALRLTLRGQRNWDELQPFLPADELEAYRHVANVPTQLMQRQAAAIAEVVANDTAETLVLAQLETTLTEITAVQGGCERIKTTVFPDCVTYVTGAMVWGVLLLVPIAFLEHDDPIYPLEIVWILFIALAFPAVHQLGTDLKNPFENRANDTPMTALCRTIEIDLRQQLGERETPPPLKPVDGVLM